jgi:hypothetical protein
VDPITVFFMSGLAMFIGGIGWLVLDEEGHKRIALAWGAFWCTPPLIRLWLFMVLS